jgi:hypothetical protein
MIKMEKMLHKQKWFWAWADEREEDWLRQMAQSGWHLKAVAPFGVYTFTAGPVEDVIYRLDFQSQSKKPDRQEYFQLFEDAGWEHVAEMSNWQYFRKPAAAGGPAEIFTDQVFRIKKYQRVCGLLAIVMVVLLVQFNNLLRAAERYDLWITTLQIIYVVLLGFFVYAIARLLGRITHLKRLQKTRQ